MTDDQRDIALQQLANIIIDAYLNRDKRFIPKFEPGSNSVIYLSRPDGADPRLELNFWYEKADYELENPS